MHFRREVLYLMQILSSSLRAKRSNPEPQTRTGLIRRFAPRNDGWRRLPPERALRIDIQRVDRLARGHEQAVALDAAEADIGAALGQCDAADHDAVGRVDHDAVELGIAHAPAAPQIAVDVAAHAVRRARAGVDMDALVGNRLAAGVDIVSEDLAGRHAAGFHDVEN